MSADKKAFKGTLDPADWDETRASRRTACWMTCWITSSTSAMRRCGSPCRRPSAPRFVRPCRMTPQAIEDIHAEFLTSILPYGSGNTHPRFMGWVQGAGTVPGMLAEMLAAGLNANLGGRDHSGIEVERQLVQWVREMFGFPDSASGVFVTGTSMANFMAVLVARTRALGTGVRRSGVVGHRRLRGYTSVAAHGCIKRAFDYAGPGDRMRLSEVGTDASHK